MAHWLARERSGQISGYIQRFDPRFWTIDFPRPMMASTVATGPASVRVDCEFWHEGELAGLIWHSADTHDHPLLAYETRRDYSHCELRFRWRSAGLVPLDATNGPTLTIEGRDASGAARVWFVRLWNYASGTPQDARISIAFSDLDAGWSLPGEKVHPADIDRMFISLAPANYVEGSTNAFAEARAGWAELSDIGCDGRDAMLPIGDVFCPAHGIGMATAYDDCLNQSPQRLVRQIEQLGYRGRVVHYLGMSHYYRLRPDPDGSLLVDRAGKLCEPMRRWHEAYFAALADHDLEPVASLSYEVFAAHCPQEFRQRFADGSPALTGWSPPSALLSPASPAVDTFLQGTAREVVRIMEAAGCPVLFQIGEPWWWIDPASREPALYDDAAQASLGSGTVPIADMTAPLDADQLDLLDRAGAVLAASTGALADAVRDEASGQAEVMLLLFTPTVLDPAMPEARRANMPLGWAWPAYDRLQLEDYDWVVAGRESDCRRGWAIADDRLGYPLAMQDYLAGFVLDPGDADTLWPLIDEALSRAAARGFARRFVWALPQVARDGYTRMTDLENDMQAFDDLAYPLPLGRTTSVSPEFSTTIATTASGHERRNALWSDARLHFDVGPGIRSEQDLGTLLAFFRARLGPARGFRLPDPFDFSSNGMTGVPTGSDQIIGTGDGSACRFPLIKSYGDQQRRITRPRADTVAVTIDHRATDAWTLDDGGTIVFDDAPAIGAVVRAGFLFDVPVRFAEDRLEVSALSLGAGEAPSVPVVELREFA